MREKLKLEREVCLGHLGVRLNGSCGSCAADSSNRNCPDYRAVHVYSIEESDEPHDKNNNNPL